MAADLWSLGGLRARDLVRRTARETWQDEVFGQAARLSFYLFLSLFPSLVLLLLLLRGLGDPGDQLRGELVGSFKEVLPGQASDVIAKAISQLTRAGGGTWFAVLACVWGALNGTSAMIAGLNKAYEVEERRPWWRLAATVVGLTLAQGVLGVAALFLILHGAGLGETAGASAQPGLVWKIVHWPVVGGMLLVSFALLYRFGPDLENERLRWSTPGAAVSVGLWIAVTVAFREYVNHFNSYPRIYGPMAGAAVLLLWAYFTSAVILIGGEMNSEIEKASAQGETRPDGKRRQS